MATFAPQTSGGPVEVSTADAIAMAAHGVLADTHGPLIRLDRSINASLLGTEPVVAIGADVIIDTDAELRQVVATVKAAPIASVALATLLRTTVGAPLATRFALESATYSTLQAGPEFAAWAQNRTAHSSRDTASAESELAVLVERLDNSAPGALHLPSTLTVTLNRPHHGNAIDNAVRDLLVLALTIAVLDKSIGHIELRGNGANFCTGGDLDTFATLNNPAEAHAIRLQRSPARQLAALGSRVHAFVHGKCVGSGVELAAFANSVSAAPNTTFGLPELSLGLVPGAGGTISIVDRIGAQRTAWMLFTQRSIDTSTALAWGLIDRVI